MPRTRSAEYWSAAALLLTVCALTTGCSHSSTTSSGSVPARAAGTASPLPRPTIGAIPVIDSTADKSMPIEDYLFSAAQLNQVTAARDRLAGQCMHRFALTYTPTPQPRSRPGGQATHRYDVVDPANGYRPPGATRTASTPPPRMTPEEITVLAGNVPGSSKSITSYHGLTIPKGGCLGWATAKLTAQGGSTTDDRLAIGINFGDYQRSMTDGTLKAVFHQWSDCMKTMGFSYATPTDAMSDKRWKGTATPSTEEIATATADAACRRKTNVIGTWFAVESAYENQDIQANLDKLNQVRRGIAAVLKIAATVNRGGSL